MTDNAPIHDGTDWRGSDFSEARSWVLPLDATMASEILRATEQALAAGLQYWEVTRDSFPIPQCEPTLRHALGALETGRGFTVLSGFPVDRLSADEARIAYAGVCSYFGNPIVQNGAAERMVDVRDIGREYSHRSRGYSGTALLPFHTDGTKGEAEMLHYTGLLCLETAAEGGLSAIASATTVYNEVITRRPELMPVLKRGFHHHRQGDHPADHSPISAERIPVFSFSNGLLHCRFNRNNMEWAGREGVALNDLERDALGFVDEIVAGPDTPLSMDLRKGDLQIINNFTILHSRSEYIDAPDRKRHLLRLWLNNPEARRDGHKLVELFAAPESRFSDRPWRDA